jgi:hypothetical protein
MGPRKGVGILNSYFMRKYAEEMQLMLFSNVGALLSKESFGRSFLYGRGKFSNE